MACNDRGRRDLARRSTPSGISSSSATLGLGAAGFCQRNRSHSAVTEVAAIPAKQCVPKFTAVAVVSLGFQMCKDRTTGVPVYAPTAATTIA